MNFIRLLALAFSLLALGATLTACSTVDKLSSPSGYQSREDGIFTPLNAAIREGDVEQVKKLLAEGASPDEDADYGAGADSIPVGNLSLAVNFNEEPLEMVRLLLEAGADPARDFPAFSDAIDKGDLEVAELLAQHGADVNGGLQSAVMSGQMDMIRLMLNYGADPNEGVMLAKMTYNEEALSVLEEAGAVVKDLPREQTRPECYKTERGETVRIC